MSRRGTRIITGVAGKEEVNTVGERWGGGGGKSLRWKE
jgi:hypothetical protein